jgi:hypothetical protein
MGDFNLDETITALNKAMNNIGDVSHGAALQGNGIGQILIILFCFVLVGAIAWFFFKKLASGGRF